MKTKQAPIIIFDTSLRDGEQCPGDEKRIGRAAVERDAAGEADRLAAGAAGQDPALGQALAADARPGALRGAADGGCRAGVVPGRAAAVQGRRLRAHRHPLRAGQPEGAGPAHRRTTATASRAGPRAGRGGAAEGQGRQDRQALEEGQEEGLLLRW